MGGALSASKSFVRLRSAPLAAPLAAARCVVSSDSGFSDRNAFGVADSAVKIPLIKCDKSLLLGLPPSEVACMSESTSASYLRCSGVRPSAHAMCSTRVFSLVFLCC